MENTPKIEDRKENANVDSNTAMGKMLLIGSNCAKDHNLDKVIPSHISDAHRRGQFHIHDLDFYEIGTTTCIQIDLLKLFSKPFSTGHGSIRVPQTIHTYAMLACIVLQCNQNEQHGGQSIPNFDYSLAPGVWKSYVRNLIANVNRYCVMNGLGMSLTEIKALEFEFDEIKRELSDFSIDLPVDILIKMSLRETEEQTFQAMEALTHNLNSMHSRAGSQIPFTSLNFGTDTSVCGRMVVKCLLKALRNGLGGGETPIFPITVFKVKDGINLNPKDPNYDLFQVAMEVSSKRLFPNFVFLDAPFNLQYYRPGLPETEVATMGCVDYKETVDVICMYEHEDDNACFSHSKPRWKVYKNMCIGRLFQKFKANNKCRKTITGKSTYIETSNYCFIRDGTEWTRCKGVLVNDMVDDWYSLKLACGYELKLTGDHPLIINGIVTQVKNCNVGDIVEIVGGGGLGKEIICTSVISSLEPINNLCMCSYDVETETGYFNVSGFHSHNCRTRVIGSVFPESDGHVYGRGNLSFTSVNLPRIALETRHIEADRNKMDVFMDVLKSRMSLVREQLLHRFDIQCSKQVYNFPFLLGQGLWFNSDIEGLDLKEMLKHGSLGIGFVGLAECLKVIYPNQRYVDEEVQQAGLEIIKLMRKTCGEFAKELHLNFTLLATPAESLSGRFASKDKKEFGVIEGVTDRLYYTNSFHVPVYEKVDILTKIKTEAPYHALCDGGAITYIEVDGDITRNLRAFETIIRLMKQYGIGYGAINHPIDRCMNCTHEGEINQNCPKCCSGKIERIRRITGYLVGSLSTWNEGKKAEEADRLKHKF